MNNHITVMLNDAVEALGVKQGAWYIDGTFGRGGHTRKILEQGGKVIAFDFDQEAIIYGQQTFKSEIIAGDLILVRENFAHLADTIVSLQKNNQVGQINGILFDFGTSTQQLTSQERGFSFEGEGPLDMRMDQRLGVMAKDLLAVIPENQLTELFRVMGGEQEAKRIAKAIKSSKTPIATTKQLADLVSKVKGRQKGKLHPATKVFQALRIAVNTELDNITDMLPQALNVLHYGGKIVTIAFHEGEDKIVKHTFKSWESRNLGKNETKKPEVPSEAEISTNIRARSAKMRVFIKGTHE
ncbi:MAG: ribosomal RNA small subunit methyltransferase H [Patescibacteria group bacterium]|nr:MAG: ribosomal RNA small subunit methyltransferase H [Patescibacteria group bacterium]